MEERGWTKYKLAKECGTSLSSVSNMFRRHNEPTVSTLENICNAFGITMSQFFDYDSDQLTVHLLPEQKDMFDKWLNLTADQKEILFRLIDNMK